MSDETVKASEEQTQEVTEAKFDGAVADGSSLGSVEVLGGPTPQNSKPTDNSNKLKTPNAKFAQTGDVQTKGSAGTVQQDGPLGAVGLKSTGYGKGANEEAEVEADEKQEVVAEEPAKEESTETVVEAEVQEDETIDLSADVKALFAGEELSESFQEKAKTNQEKIRYQLCKVPKSPHKKYRLFSCFLFALIASCFAFQVLFQSIHCFFTHFQWKISCFRK